MLNQNQRDQLLKPLNPKRVAQRSQSGRNLSYLETWDVKAHLIRIFGFGGWDWNVNSADLAFEDQVDGKNGKQWNVGYKVIGTLTIHGIDNGRDASYTEAAVGSASLPQRGEAHDMSVKTAESDALKRAAINLGTQFGLGLYKDGSMADVVGMTLDHDKPTTVEPEPEVPSDNDGSAAWIEQMTSAVNDKDVAGLLELQKDMKQQGVQDWLYQGQTLAKWLDRAIAKVGQ